MQRGINTNVNRLVDTARDVPWPKSAMLISNDGIGENRKVENQMIKFVEIPLIRFSAAA
jgi:hypothetical protein